MFMMPALSPAENETLVRWPPSGYLFDESIFGKPDKDCVYEQHGELLKRLYPEISTWNNSNCVSAWNSYGESTNYGSTDIYEIRDKFFIAFLYAKQELGSIYDHGGLDELDGAWISIGK